MRHQEHDHHGIQHSRLPKLKQRIKLLTETLLPVAARAGIENILVDPGALDIASIGWTALAIHDIKETLRYPCGCAPLNALFTWHKLRSQGSPHSRPRWPRPSH